MGCGQQLARRRATDFGGNWQAGGGSPGLDSGFVDTDTATFGLSGSGLVTLDGASPSLRGITFDNAMDSYTLGEGSGGGIAFNGGSGSAFLTNLNGNHEISAPVDFVTDTQIQVANFGDQLLLSGILSTTNNLEILGSGRTVFAQNQSYTGPTTVTSGVLASQNLSNSDVSLGGGLFSPGNAGTVSQITVGSLALNGGGLEFDLGAAGVSDEIISSGTVTLNGPTPFVFRNAGFDAGVFSLITGTLVNFNDLSGLTFTSDIAGLQGTFGTVGDTLFFRGFLDGGVFSGPVLSNYAPYLIPVAGTFLVDGPVTTWPEGADNTIDGLIFNPNSSLRVFNNLTVTSGNFDVPTGRALIRGGNVIVPGTFSKLGSGVLNILSNVFVNGPARVVAESLFVNGTFTTGGGLTVFRNALLGGSGVITGDVFNDGTVNPGNSPGTLTINGNFTLSFPPWIAPPGALPMAGSSPATSTWATIGKSAASPLARSSAPNTPIPGLPLSPKTEPTASTSASISKMPTASAPTSADASPTPGMCATGLLSSLRSALSGNTSSSKTPATSGPASTAAVVRASDTRPARPTATASLLARG